MSGFSDYFIVKVVRINRIRLPPSRKYKSPECTYKSTISHLLLFEIVKMRGEFFKEHVIEIGDFLERFRFAGLNLSKIRRQDYTLNRNF